MTFGQLYLILFARKLTVLITFSLIFGLACFYLFITPKIYTASTSIVVEFKGVDPFTGLTIPGSLISGYMGTQIDIITSHNVALKVVRNQHLADNPATQAIYEKLNDQTSIEDWLANELVSHIDVKPPRDTTVINIDFSSKDPETSAKMANALAAAYIVTTLELKVAPAKSQAAWFDEQTTTLRNAVEEAQQHLSDYQQEIGMVAPDEKLDLEITRLGELSSQLVKAQNETYDIQTRQQQIANATAKGRLEELPDIQHNSMIQSLKTELAHSEAKFAEMSEGMSGNHPQMQRIQAEIDSLKQKLAAEIRTASASLTNAAKQAKMRESEIERALAEQHARVLQLKEVRGKLILLRREVDNAQRTYDSAHQRSEQIRLESERNQTEVAVLNPAIVPAGPSKPKKSITLLLAGVLGVLLGVGFAVIREIQDKRIRCEEDILSILNMPVLAQLSANPISSKKLAFPSIFRI
ncbi:MAG: chain length determinant protein EpsF [Methylomonas sp.]|jgi:chain length determinant protein EpsF